VEWDAVSIPHPHMPRPWNPIRATLVRAFGQFARNWADTPIQNRRPRRCRGGLEHILLHRSSRVRTEGRDQGSRLPWEEIMGLVYHKGARTWGIQSNNGSRVAWQEMHQQYAGRFFVSQASKALLWPWIGRLTRAIAAAAGSRWMPHAGRKTAAAAGRLDGQPASGDENC
jgi:hypothetical protein